MHQTWIDNTYSGNFSFIAGAEILYNVTAYNIAVAGHFYHK
jgi:hypothetical protein